MAFKLSTSCKYIPFKVLVSDDVNLHYPYIEEFMLLANMTVAKFIADAYPDRAMLRCHPEPNERKMKELDAFARQRGVAVNASSSGALHRSLQALAKADYDAYGGVMVLSLFAICSVCSVCSVCSLLNLFTFF